MSITDILSSLRDYFTWGQSEADRAADAAADIAINTWNVINWESTPLAPAPFVPVIPNFDNQSVNITPILDVNTPSPALQAADLALQAAQAGTNTWQPITLPEAPAPATISPAPQAPIAPVEFWAWTNVATPVAPPVIQAAQDLLPAWTQNTLQTPAEIPAPAPSIFTPPEILPATWNTPQKNTARDEIKNLGKDLLGIYNAWSEQAASRKKEEDVKEAFWYAPAISFRDASNVFEIWKIYAAVDAANGDRVKQQEIISKMLPETWYTGPTKTPEQFIQFVNDLQAASPKGQSPVEVKSLAKKYSWEFGVTEEFAQASINRGNDFLSWATAKLTTELNKLIPNNYSDGRYSGDVGNRISDIAAQLHKEWEFYNAAVSSIESIQNNAQQAWKNTASIQRDLEIATQARAQYITKQTELILIAQKAATASGKWWTEAAEAWATAIAQFLNTEWYKSVDAYMNDGLPVALPRASPSTNMQIQQMNASAAADPWLGNALVLSATTISALYLESAKTFFWQRAAEQKAIRYANPTDTEGLSSLQKTLLAIDKKTNFLDVSLLPSAYTTQNAIEGVSDTQYVDQVLTPDGVSKISQWLNYLSQNTPEIWATILAIYATQGVSELLQLSYAPEASTAVKLGVSLWNKVTESFIIWEAINGIANTTQPYVTKQQALANTFVNFWFDFGAWPVQAAVSFLPKGNLLRELAPKIIRIWDDLSIEWLTDIAARREAQKILTHDAERLALSNEDKMAGIAQKAKEITPRITQEDTDNIARIIKEIKVAWNDLWKANPELANQMLKWSVAKGKVYEDMLNIINTTWWLTDAAKLQIADSQALFNSLIEDNTVNVADMVRRLYGIDAPVFYWGFYSWLLPTEIKNLPGLAVSDIQYAVPGKVYDIAWADFNPNRVTPQQVEQLKVLSPDINVVISSDGIMALDDASKDALGIVETKQFKLQAATTKETNEIVDNLIVKGIIEEGARSKTEKLASLIEKTASKILCP